MKKIILIIFTITLLQANVEVRQNIKALYKNVKLSDQEINYILDNKEENYKRIEKASKNINKKYKNKIINEKNVIEFILHKNGTKSDYKFLSNSDKRQIDKETKKILEKTNFVKTIDDIKIRYIFIYKYGQDKISRQTNNSSNTNKNNKKPFYNNIERGTTKFEYSSKEYIRVFETNKDGFINLSSTPPQCMSRITLLKESGERVPAYAPSILGININIEKGKYKLLFQTKKDCNINVEYP